jgi:hypothetical protein
MHQQDWHALLSKINQALMSDKDFLSGNLLTAEQRQTRWLGKPGASEDELGQLEGRLQQRLPPSYRSFLAASNGFGPISSFIYDLCSTDEVAWLVEKEPELVEIWEEDASWFSDDPDLADDPYLLYDEPQSAGALRSGHMRQCLMISHWGDAGFLALNPAQQHEGEWEAWHFANWMPGARRYRSFAELMQDSYQSGIKLRQLRRDDN